jgi:hypothetical protein
MSVELPELIASEPTSRPAVVYDRYWLQTLVMRAPAPGQTADAIVTLAAYSSADGSLSGETVNLTVSDLFAKAAGDQQLADAMVSLMQAVQKIAAADGLVVANG